VNFEKESRIEERSDAFGIGELRIRRIFPKFTRPRGSQKMADFFISAPQRCFQHQFRRRNLEIISFFGFLKLTTVRILPPYTGVWERTKKSADVRRFFDILP